MQVKQIILAVAATLVAGQALAVPVTKADILAAGPANIDQTWLSGASAPNFNIYDAYAKGCDVNTVAIFSNATSVATATGTNGNFNAYVCRRAGKISIAYHTTDGGSFNAYAPHLTGTAPDGTAMPALLRRVADLATIACNPNATVYTPPATADYVTGGQTVPVSTGCAIVTPSTVPTKPVGGFSDVEAAMWGYTLAPGSEGDANVQQAFGVAVTDKLYRALQVAQGIYTTEALAIANDPSFLPANAPNITSAQYTSIVSVGGGYQTDWSPILGATGVGKNIYVTRRVETSGTQAASNAHFLQNPCASGIPGGNLAAVGQTGTTPFVVGKFSGSSDVRAALIAINAGTYAHDIDGPTQPGLATLPVNGASQGFGIGVLSAENAAPTTGWKYAKLDGAHPYGQIGTRKGVAQTANSITAAGLGRATMMEGDYQFVMEMKSYVDPVQGAIDTFGAALIPTIVAQMSGPADCAATPRGLAISPTAGSVCVTGEQVSKGSKIGNTCQPMNLFF